MAFRPPRLMRRRKYRLARKVNRIKRRGFKPLRHINQTGFLKLTRRTKEFNFLNGATSGSVSLGLVGLAPDALQVGTAENIYGDVYNLPFTMTFRLSDIISSSDITQLADQYRINWVKVSINYNSNNADANSAASIPGIYWIADQDDASVQNVSSLREKMGLRYAFWGSSRTHLTAVMAPKPAALLYQDSGTGYQIPLKRTWINSGSPSVPHYGIKGYFTNLYLPSNVGKTAFTAMTFDVTYSISAKDFQ